MREIESYCEICKKNTLSRTAFRNKQITVIRCLECKTLFRLLPQHLKGNLERNSEEYYAESIRCGQGNRLFFRLSLQGLIKSFPRIAGGAFLDFGCGSGNALFAARELGFRGYGVESSPCAIEYCKKQGIEAVPGLEHLQGGCINFDVINLNHVLEHVSDPIFLLNNLSLFLKKDGIMRIEVPNCRNINYWQLLTAVKYVKNNFCRAHNYYFDKNSLKNVLLKSGFSVIRLDAEGFGAPFRHQATLINPDWRVRTISDFLFYSKIENKFHVESFIVALVQK